jgi:hypothetical protein
VGEMVETAIGPMMKLAIGSDRVHCERTT